MRKNNTVFSFVYSPKRGQNCTGGTTHHTNVQETVRAMKDRQDCLGTTLTDQVKGWRRWVGLLSFFREKKTWRVIEEAALTGASKREQSVAFWGSLVEVFCRPTSPPSPPPQCSRHCDQARLPNTSLRSHALGSCVPFLPSPRCPTLTPPWYCESRIPAVIRDYMPCQRGGWYSYHSHRVPSSQGPAQPRQKPQLGRLSTFNKPLSIFLRWQHCLSHLQDPD